MSREAPLKTIQQRLLEFPLQFGHMQGALVQLGLLHPNLDNSAGVLNYWCPLLFMPPAALAAACDSTKSSTSMLRSLTPSQACVA